MWRDVIENDIKLAGVREENTGDYALMMLNIRVAEHKYLGEMVKENKKGRY